MDDRRDPREFTRLSEIWDVLQRHAPMDEWIPIERIYEIVRDRLDPRGSDLAPAAPQSRQAKWKRNVRNVLQHRKTPGKTRPASILWDAPTRSYLIPREPGVLSPAPLAPSEEDVFPEGVFALDVDPSEAFVVDSLLDARRRDLRAIAIRQGGRAFRRALLEAYDHRCAATATNAPVALEAAHILPYRGAHTNHVANGLLLRADVHTLFDFGLLAINPYTYTLATAPALGGTDYAALAGRPISVPKDPHAQPSQRSLLRHYAASRVVA